MTIKSIGLIATLIAGSLSAVAQPVTIQADRWMPLNSAPAEQPVGYAVELLVEVFATDATPVSYTLNPWAEAVSHVSAGSADAVIGAAKDEAPTLVFPSEPVAHVDYGLWAKTPSSFVYSPEALKTVRVGVLRGYTYWPELDALIAAHAPNLTVYGGDNALADAIEALHDGSIDLFPESAPVFAWAVREQALDPAQYVSKHSHDGGFIYVAFANTPRGQALATKWDATIPALRANGTLSRILGRYDVSDWVPTVAAQ